MMVAFWVIVLLVGVLLFRNARQIIDQYNIDKNKAKLLIYLGPLLVLGYLFIHMTSRTINFVQTVQEQEASGDEQLVAEVRQGTYVARIFRRHK